MLISIGKCREDIYYDVCDMDACHLGMPWQFDVNDQHLG